MRLLLTRPRPDAEELAERLRQSGHEAVLSPVMEVVCHEATLPDLGKIAAVIITSRNALTCLARQNALAVMTALPAFAVGAATAKLASDSGFANVIEGPGTAAELVPLIESSLNAPCQLYHPAGVIKAFDLKEPLSRRGFEIIEDIIYETKPVYQLSNEAVHALNCGKIDAVVLMSPRSARLFVNLVEKSGLKTRLAELEFLCLSATVAEALGNYKGTCRIAATPNLRGMLSLIGEIEK